MRSHEIDSFFQIFLTQHVSVKFEMNEITRITKI